MSSIRQFPSEGYEFFRTFESFHAILRYYVDLGCFLVSYQSSDWVWRSLHHPHRILTLFDLEKKHLQLAKRKKFIEESIEKALRLGRPTCATHLGFGDWFVPIRRGPQSRDLIQSGTFAFQEVTAEGLAASWKELTGRKALSIDPDYQEFVRMAVEMPVLEGPTWGAYRQALEMLAEIFTGPYEPSKSRLFFQRLLGRVFSKHFPHYCFLDWACGRPTFPFTPPWDRETGESQWLKEEIGIRRLPTTVIALAPHWAASQAPDAVEDMLSVYRLRRAAFTAGKFFPETFGGRMGDQGAVFLTSADPRWPKSRHRLYLEKTAEELKEWLEKKTGIPLRVGVGNPVSPGTGLQDSYRQASLALYRSQPQEGALSFFDTSLEGTPSLDVNPEAILRELCQAMNGSHWTALESLRDRFVDQALLPFPPHPQVVRLHFRYGLCHLAEALRRGNAGSPESEEWFRAIESSLESSATVPELVEAFRKGVERLRQYSLKPALIADDLTMEKVVSYIDENFQKPLRLRVLARLAGTANSTFSRSFTRIAGKGFGAYLQDKRLAKAEGMLRSGALPVSQVSHDCGFKSVSYFIRLFCRRHGMTPDKYRNHCGQAFPSARF